MALNLKTLTAAVEHDAALRRVRRLQPVGGQSDKIFPPTYPPAKKNDGPPRHVFEQRRVAGEKIWCVLIDSVQSQANRLEESLLAAVTEDKNLSLPYATVDFSDAGLAPLEQITSLDAPHRVYDAIFRDSLLNDEPFMKSEEGQRLAEAKPADATVLMELSPTALLFGAWHSQGEGGGLGAKFPRTLVSEIMGINTPVEGVPDRRTGEVEPRTLRHDVITLIDIITDRRTGEVEPQTAGRRTGSRIDPLGILKGVEVFKSPSGWDTNEKSAGKKAKKCRPSEINHGNIAPSVTPLGVTCDYAEHRAVITLAGIRKLRFGNTKRDAAGRTLIAALGLMALAEQDERGYALRSRCDLVCDGAASLELVHPDGSSDVVELDHANARKLYQEAYKHAAEAGFKFKSLTLKPQEKLIKIVKESRKLALEGKGGDDESES